MYPMVRLIYDKHLFSPNILIHYCQEKWFRDLIKWSPKRKRFDLLLNSLNLSQTKEMYEYQSGEFVCGYWGLKGQLVLIQLCTQTNKPCFEIVNLQSFTHFINSPCSRVEKNYRCIKSEKARILFSNMHKSYNNKLYYGISNIIF